MKLSEWLCADGYQELNRIARLSPDGKVPKDGFRTAQQKTWVGLNGGRVLGWTLPQEFSEAEASALAKEMEQKWKGSHPLPDGAVPEFATVPHRDGWKYHLVTRVLREPGSPRPPAPARALFTAESRFIVPADALVGLRLDQSSKDGPKTELGLSVGLISVYPPKGLFLVSMRGAQGEISIHHCFCQ